MKKLLHAASFLTILFTGCFDDDDPVSNSGSLSSQSEVYAGINVDDKDDLAEVVVGALDGGVLELNPKLTFTLADPITVDYENDQNDSGYPQENALNLPVELSVEDTRLIISFTHTSEKRIELGFSFIDRGGEGYLDEVQLDLARVDNEEQVVTKQSYYIADQAISKNLYNTNVDEPLVYEGAPTVEQWNKYIVGNSILNISSDDVVTLLHISDTSTGKYYEEIEGEVQVFDATYTYSKTDQNKGLLTLTVKGIKFEVNDVLYSITLEAETRIEFNSNDIFGGSWTQSNFKYTDEATGELINISDLPDDTDILDDSDITGTSKVYSNLSFALEENKLNTLQN